VRIGYLEKSILIILLKSGAKTIWELAKEIESIDTWQKFVRHNAYQRTIRQLKKKGFVRVKPYFKFSKSFYGFMRNRFWAEGHFWKRYYGSGFYVEKTKTHRYSNYWRYGLTVKGRKEILKRLVVPEREATETKLFVECT